MHSSIISLNHNVLIKYPDPFYQVNIDFTTNQIILVG